MSRPEPAIMQPSGPQPDLRDIKGQESAKRTLEIAAAGAHNLLMSGPPGAGKSMLAQRLPSISAAAHPARASGNLHDPVGRGLVGQWRALEPSAVPRAPPFRLHGGAGGRRHQCAARRGITCA